MKIFAVFSVVFLFSAFALQADEPVPDVRELLKPIPSVPEAENGSTLLPKLSICVGAPEDNDKDLLPPLSPVADEDNGWLLLNKLPQANKTSLERERRNKMLIYPSEGTDGKIDRECVAELLKNHADLISLTRQMMARPQFQVIPEKEKLFEPWIAPNANRLSLGLRTILAQALIAAQDGNPAKAWTDISAAAKLCARVGRARSNIVYLASGMVFLRLTAEAAAWAGLYVKDPAILRQWATDLLPFENLTPQFMESIRGEYSGMKQLDAFFEKGGDDMKRTLLKLHLSRDLPPPSGATPNKTPAPEKPDDAASASIDALMKDPPKEVQVYLNYAAATNWDEVKRIRARYFRSALKLEFSTMEDFQRSLPPVPAGLVPSVRHHIKTDRETRETAYTIVLHTTAGVRLARLSLLLRAWSLDHAGELPERLDQLVSEYVPAVPLDPFDGKPVRYDRKRKILWSVERDLKDDGGTKDGDKDRVQPL